MFKSMLVTSIVLAASVPAMATVLVSDPFTDGGRTNGADALDIAWWQTGGTGPLAMFAVQNDPSTSSNALFRDPNGGFSSFIGFFGATAQSLAVGDSISLSLDVRFTTLPANQNNAFRFGLYNSQGTQQADDFGGNSGNNFNNRLGDAGYYAGLNFGTASNLSAFFREVDTGGVLVGGAEVVGVGTNFASVVVDLLPHNLRLIVSRTAVGLDLSYSYDNGTPVVRSDTTPITTAFDTIVIGQGNAVNPFYIDNVNVVYTPIPEPTLAAVLLGTACLALRRRSKTA